MNRETVRFVYGKKSRSNDKLFGTFDIETQGLGGPFIEGATYINGEVRHYLSAEELFLAMIDLDRGHTPGGDMSKRSVTWYAHNGAGYDFSYLAHLITQYAYENNFIVETIQQGQKPIQLTIPSKFGKVKLVDTYPFLDASLENASRAYAPEYSKLGHCKLHDFTKVNSGPADWYNPDCPECSHYLDLDVISLWHTYANARALVIKTFGIEPGLTAGATAMRAWVSMIPEGHVYYRQAPDKEKFAKLFTTGAFTYPGNTTDLLTPESGEDYAAVTIDRSAAFAACQYEGGYPVSAGIWTVNHTSDMFGFWECDAYCPPNVFPCVPLSNKGGKLWATGAGIAYVTSEQYDFCIKLGYTLKVKRGLVFPKVEDVFTTFIKTCEDLEYPPNGQPADPAIKALAKRMRNSLNGKFNIRNEMDRLYIGDGINVEGAKPVIDPDTGNPLPLYTIREPVDAPYAQPVWYAITVSRQQLEEHRLRLLMGNKTYKFDTDSATSRPNVIQEMIDSGAVVIGPGYGNYKVEHYWLALQSIGPKNYMGVELRDGQPVDVGNCKGIPVKTMKQYRAAQKRAANGERIQVEFESTRTLIEMLKSNYETPGIIRKRSISVPDSSEGWVWNETDKTFTPHHREDMEWPSKTE